MLKQLLCATSLVLIGASAWADVIVKVPEEIVVVAVDDQEIRGGLFKSKENTLKLDAGQHSISVKYQDIFNHLDGEHDVLKSEVVTLNALPLKDGEQYRLTLLNAPKDFEQAKAFAQQPSIAIENRQGQVIAQQTGVNSAGKPWLNHGVFGSMLDLREHKTAQTPPNPQPVANAVLDAKQNNNAQQDTKAQQLIVLWQSATPQERQKFMAWLTEQASK